MIRHALHGHPLRPESRTETRSEGVTIERWSDLTGSFVRSLHRNSGIPITDNYSFENKWSRLDGPAVVEYDDQGRLKEEHWFVDGVPHRVGGPAETYYGPDGVPRDWGWWIFGKSADSSWEAAEILGHTAPEKLRPAIELSPYAPLLAEGHTPEAIVDVLIEGPTTVEGIRAVLDGAPVDWALSFESGSSR